MLVANVCGVERHVLEVLAKLKLSLAHINARADSTQIEPADRHVGVQGRHTTRAFFSTSRDAVGILCRSSVEKVLILP
jgi:hypothetical protein